MIQDGVAKLVRYKKQAGGLGVIAGTTGGQALRRVTSLIDLSKGTYQSNEKRSDFQVGDYRHGARRVEGPLSGELSPLTYADFMAAILRRDFAAVAAITGLSLTIAASGALWTITRAAGSWLTDGAKVGDGVRLTAGAFNAANSNKNLQIVDLTALVMTVFVMNGSALVAEGPIATATVSFPGKKTFVPSTGHTNDLFTIEHYYSLLDESEVFVDCKPGTMRIGLPATGLSTVDWGFLGRDMQTFNTAAAPYFTSPAAETSTGILAAVNGVILLGTTPIATLSNLELNVNGNVNSEPVAGSNVAPDVFRGRVVVTGEFSAFLENMTFRDAFKDETEVSLFGAFTTSNQAAADFLAFSMSRMKLQGAGKDDPETGIKQRVPFQALVNGAGGAGVKHEKTTISLQDSAIP